MAINILERKRRRNLASKKWRLNNIERARELSKIWNKKNPENIKEAKIRFKERNPDYSRLYNQRIHSQYRNKALEYYSNGLFICNCCGESNNKFLSIDHIENNGAQHRKDDNGATNIYYWLKKNNYPEGFQVLCFNCNIAKGIYGECH